MNPQEARAASEHLATVDPHIAVLVEEQGLIDPFLWVSSPVADDDLLGGLVFHIVGQQISTTVAQVLFGRLRAALGGAITAEALATTGQERLREAGMSGNKARALTELGERISAGTFSLESLRELDDREAEAALVSLRGIGPWSAQLFLTFQLRRSDIFPAGDLGLRMKLGRLDELPEPPSIKESVARAAIWSPFRSYAAAYLWRWGRE